MVPPSAAQQNSMCSASRSLLGRFPCRPQSGVRPPMSSSTYAIGSWLPQSRHHIAAIVPKMQVDDTSNVLLALVYGAGYAFCDRNSVIQWSLRACMTAVSAVLYVRSPLGDGVLLAVLVSIVSDLCDNHRDALGITQCVIGAAVVGFMTGDAGHYVDRGGWAPTLASTCMALFVPHRAGGLPSLDAVALVLATVVPVFSSAHQALARVVGLWTVLYFYGNAPMCMPVHKVVYVVVSPWPAACVVAMAQIALVNDELVRRRGWFASSNSDTVLVPTVMV